MCGALAYLERACIGLSYQATDTPKAQAEESEPDVIER